MKSWLLALFFKPGEQERVGLTLLLEEHAEENGHDATVELVHELIEQLNAL